MVTESDFEKAVRRKARALLAELTPDARQALKNRDRAAIEAADRMLQARLTPQEMRWAVETGALMVLEGLREDSSVH